MYKIKEVDVKALEAKEINKLFQINKIIIDKYKLIDTYNTLERFNNFLSRFKDQNKLFIMEVEETINGILTFTKQKAWDATDQYVLEISITNKNIEEGISKEVVKLVEALSTEYSPIALNLYNHELDEAVKKLNGKIRLNSQCYSLRKEDIDIDKLNNSIEQLNVKNKDLTINCFIDVPEEYIEGYCKLFMDGTGDMPDVKEEGFIWCNITPEYVKGMKEGNKKNNGTHHCCLVLNSNNEVIGMSNVIVNNNDSRYPYQFMITVKKEYRGRGIGKWMYASIYKKLYETIDFEKVYLYHHPTNKPAIDVSEFTGYKKQHLKITYILAM